MVSGSLSSRSYPRVVEDHRVPPLMARPPCPAPPYTSRRPPIYTPTPDERLRTEIYISLPVPARLAPLRSESSDAIGRSESPFTAQGRAWDTFFGRSGRSNSSREKGPSRRVMGEEASSEPETMAKHLFWYGFAFPLFWLLGIFVLFSPLESLEDPVSISIDVASTSSITSTTPRRIHTEDLDLMRATERRWALRCCLAWFGFLLIIALVIVILWMAHVGPFASHP
ncbi:hypothetical protein BDV93DRAFT_522728 [Ceratobasidium sp. AG-I]|nr:hypothetical protein BDV93DRAFT_522728 [Ceratobasidium sp. AG-I]